MFQNDKRDENDMKKDLRALLTVVAVDRKFGGLHAALKSRGLLQRSNRI